MVGGEGVVCGFDVGVELVFDVGLEFLVVEMIGVGFEYRFEVVDDGVVEVDEFGVFIGFGWSGFKESGLIKIEVVEFCF